MDLNEKIAGEITMSDSPGAVIRKWRNLFNVSQTGLANHIGIAPSVISDYEKGRRKPGTGFVREIVSTLIAIDEERGGEVVKRFTPPGREGLLEIGEFSEPVGIEELTEMITGNILTEESEEWKRDLYGYTFIDSLKAITSMKSFDYLQLYGWSTERVLFFTGVEYGRSPMVAIRSSPLTPAAVCYIQPGDVDSLAIKLADIENIPLMITGLDLDDVIERVKDIKKLRDRK